MPRLGLGGLADVRSSAANPADAACSRLVGGAGQGHLDAHTPDGAVDVLACADDDDWICEPIPGPFAQVSGVGLAITEDGWLHARSGWVHEGMGPLDRSRPEWLVISSGSVAAVNTRHELHAYSTSVSFWPLELHGQPIAVVGTGWEYAFGGCALDETGLIDCVGSWAGGPLDGDGWRMLDGDGEIACAVRASDDLVVCQDGTELAVGPIRAVAAQGYSLWHPDGYWTSPGYRSTNVCVLTLANELVCVGPRYPPDVQEQIESLNETHRLDLWGGPF